MSKIPEDVVERAARAEEAQRTVAHLAAPCQIDGCRMQELETWKQRAVDERLARVAAERLLAQADAVIEWLEVQQHRRASKRDAWTAELMEARDQSLARHASLEFVEAALKAYGDARIEEAENVLLDLARPSVFLLAAGEMTAQEKRSVIAVLGVGIARVRALKSRAEQKSAVYDDHEVSSFQCCPHCGAYATECKCPGPSEAWSRAEQEKP